MTNLSSIDPAVAEFFKTSNIVKVDTVSGGCINETYTLETSSNTKYFLKLNNDSSAEQMFSSEHYSLNLINQVVPSFAPSPLSFGPTRQRSGGYLIMEYFLMKNDYSSTQQKMLAEKLSKMHAYSGERKEFGFDVVTMLGSTPQDNEWDNDWLSFFKKKRLQYIVDKILETEKNHELSRLWIVLESCLDRFFGGLGGISPSLLHGDLWSGNHATNTITSSPVIFDPACYYGHHEAELSIMTMFGGITESFWAEYHRYYPRSNNFDKRHQLYQLYHYLNHWYLFGGGYKSQSLGIMKELTRY
ncbi:fructosamine 3 kinase [Paraphysoderma sedebokerense]|nr:fructosamine 3 kinase [Paraphysoderma sedebokerense]